MISFTFCSAVQTQPRGVIDVVDAFETAVGAAALHFRLQSTQSGGFHQEPQLWIRWILLVIRAGPPIRTGRPGIQTHTQQLFELSSANHFRLFRLFQD